MLFPPRRPMNPCSKPSYFSQPGTFSQFNSIYTYYCCIFRRDASLRGEMVALSVLWQFRVPGLSVRCQLSFQIYVFKCLYDPPWSTPRHWDRWEFIFGLPSLHCSPIPAENELTEWPRKLCPQASTSIFLRTEGSSAFFAPSF